MNFVTRYLTLNCQRAAEKVLFNLNPAVEAANLNERAYF
jgi:hypothetical protein